MIPKLRFKRDDGTSYPKLDKKKIGLLTEAYKVRNKSKLPLEIYSINNQAGFIPQEEQFENGGYLKNVDTSIYMIVPPNHFAYNPARINVGSIGYQNTGKTVQVSSLYEVFKTREFVDDMFLWQWFQSFIFKNAINRLQEGGVRLYYYYDKLEQTDINLPCLEEQNKIGECLLNIDKLINVYQREVDTLINIKKGLMQKIFSQEIRFKADDGNEFPEWKSIKLIDIISVCDKTKHPSGNAVPNGKYPFFVNNTNNTYKLLNTYDFDGEYIISNTGGQAHFKFFNGKFAAMSDCLVFSSRVNTKWLYYCLSNIINYIDKVGFAGSGIKHLDKSLFYGIKLLVPNSQYEQQKIADCLSAMDEKIASAQKELETLKTIKKGFLQQMFV